MGSSPHEAADARNTEEKHGDEHASLSLYERKDVIDLSTFEQILEMDDDEDDREFSKSIVYDFFTQADNTFTSLRSCLEQKDLDQLSALGHFLKGSSATLGLIKLKDSCEKIQHFGSRLLADGTTKEPDDKKSLERCHETIEQAREEFDEAEKVLRKFFEDDEE